MTEFKYCVHCENEPEICFSTEVDAMKFARECTDTCSCVKVEKSEIDEDGEILNNEVIWAADCDDVIEKEIVSDNEFDTEFPVSDIENINISDDIDYDEIAKQYKEDPADWIDDNKLIKEAVDALEENESEVECKCCFDIFPKENCVKTEKGYICKKCNQELHSHQGTNLDLIDSDPFSLDYEDPRDFDEPEEIEIKEEPVNANEVRKFEKAINEELKVIIDFSNYKPWSGAVDTYELIKDADKLDELEFYLEELYPDGITATQINDILWFDSEEVLKYLGLGDEEEEEMDEALEEHINDRPADIESDQEYQGVDNAVVDCKKYTVVAHSEDEKPVDCKLEKPALEEPLAGKKLNNNLYEETSFNLAENIFGAIGRSFKKLGKNIANTASKIWSFTEKDKQLDEYTKNILHVKYNLFARDNSKGEDFVKQSQEFEHLFDAESKAKELSNNNIDTKITVTDVEGNEINLLVYRNKKLLKDNIDKFLDAIKLATQEEKSEEPADAESNDKTSTDNAASVTKIKANDAAAALKNAYPNNDKQIRIVLSMLKKANLTEDINENLEEAKKDDELPVDPEAAKLEVHTMLNDLVADEIEAINGYDDAKAQIIDTPIEHKDSILDTIDHIKEEEQEHIDELIDATTEIPFEKEEAHDFVAEEESLAEETHAKYAKPEGDRVAAYNNALKYAKKENKPYIYGYTNHTGKFFAAETPMKVTGSPVDAEKEFRSRYKNCNVVYVVYPDKDFIDENLKEDKKVDELPVDPEAAKLNVHTMLNDLVADEIEAINGYEDAKSEIVDTPIAHKDNILDTIDHIKEEEQEHIDELIDAATEIPFDKEEETMAPEVEEPFNQDFPEVDEDLDEKILTETKAKPEGNKIKSYNDGLKLAKLNSKPVIYGYTNSSYDNKFFALDDPIICDNVSDETKKFKQQYKSCNVVYVAYPNDQFIED